MSHIVSLCRQDKRNLSTKDSLRKHLGGDAHSLLTCLSELKGLAVEQRTPEAIIVLIFVIVFILFHLRVSSSLDILDSLGNWRRRFHSDCGGGVSWSAFAHRGRRCCHRPCCCLWRAF